MAILRRVSKLRNFLVTVAFLTKFKVQIYIGMPGPYRIPPQAAFSNHLLHGLFVSVVSAVLQTVILSGVFYTSGSFLYEQPLDKIVIDYKSNKLTETVCHVKSQ